MLAPAIAAVVGTAAAVLWERRGEPAARLVLAALLAGTSVWSFVLLERTPSWQPWLRVVVLMGGLATALVIALRGSAVRRQVLAALVAAGLALGLAAPAAYTLSTVSSAQSGQNVSAGPAVASAGGFGGTRPGGAGAGGGPLFGGPPPSAPGLAGGPGGARGFGGTRGARAQSGVSRALVSLVTRSASRYTWVAATTDWQTAASIELAGGGKAVMAIGGFSGLDNMTLARFEALVAQGKVHYFIAAGGPEGGAGQGPGGSPSAAGFAPPTASGPEGGGPGGAGPGGAAGRRTGSEIESWVASHYRAITVAGTTVYDLTQPKAGA
jgi:hypothetical protein